MSVELIAIRISPWSERARWALDYSGIDYRYTEFQLMLSEPVTRLRLRQWTGRVTAPILVRGDDEPLRDSIDIARWADAHRRTDRSPLFPAGRAGDLERLLASIGPAQEAGRARTTRRVANNRAARLENLPRSIPGAVRPLFAPLAAFGVRYFINKYDMSGHTDEGDTRLLRAALTDVRTALADRDYVLGDDFTFADIASACLLHFVAFPQAGPGRLGPANRACWNDPELALEFADLVQWRDRLYERHR